jgi:predicted HAD superfamily Cof-like phosphohydrolase
MSQLDDVHFSFTTHGISVAERPVKVFDPDRVTARKNAMREALEHTMEAFDMPDGPHKTIALAEALAEQLYAVNGTAVVFGIQLDDVFDEFHSSIINNRDPNISQAIWPMPHNAW